MESMALDAKLSRLVDIVLKLFTALLHCLHELLSHLFVKLTEKDTPLGKRGLFVHLVLDLPVDVVCRLNLEFYPCA